MTDHAEKRGQLIRHLEDALALADEIEDGQTGLLIERALDEARTGAFRRSELVALNVEDIEETPEGALVTLRRSKTDQEGLGRRVAIPRGEIACPVAALRTWLDAAGIAEGAIFRRCRCRVS
jgi:hypothetical protein